MQGILFLGNKMQDATSQDLDPMSREDTPQSWSGENTPGSYIRKDSWHASILYQERTVDTPQSYVRRGQWTHLNPGSGENSEHTSILVRREQWTHLNPGQERIPIYQERPYLDPLSVWERNISIPNNNRASKKDSKLQDSEGEWKRRRWLWSLKKICRKQT